MKIRVSLALLALTVLGCGGHHHHASSSTPIKVTARTAAVLGTVNANGTFTEHIATLGTTNVGTFLTNVAITGTDPITDSFSGTTRPERIESIDQRPSTGALYGVSETGGLYTINVTTGAATKVATVTALHDLVAQSYFVGDIDFDPTTDTLRVCISSSTDAKNLRVNPSTGALVATDTSFTRKGTNAMDSFAIAYAPSGALYALGYDTDFPSQSYYELLKVPDPSSGVATPYRTLATTYFDGTSGFDISADGADGIFIDVDDDELYLIDIATGTETSIGILPSNFTANSVAFLKPSA